MGTRLYPITDRVDLLERLAGVSEGTSERLKELEKLRETMETIDWYNEIEKYPEAMRLYDFQLFGWGKLNTEQWGIVKETCSTDEEYWCGHTRDPKLVLELLNAADSYWKETLGLINIEELDGVAWN